MDRNVLHERGAALRDQLGIDTSKTSKAIGFDAFSCELTYGAVWARGELSLEERAICTLAAQSVLGRGEALAPSIEAALRVGLSPRSLVEVFVQGGLYGGFDAADTAISVAERVFESRGLEVPRDAARNGSLDELTACGQAFLEDLHGERGTQGYASPDNPVTGELYALATQYGYGELWLRPGLDRRERLLCALVAFTVLGLDAQLRKFSVSALRVGFSRQAVIETLMQTAPYGGFPRALNALALFGEVSGAS